jgi:hypothetical protein
VEAQGQGVTDEAVKRLVAEAKVIEVPTHPPPETSKEFTFNNTMIVFADEEIKRRYETAESRPHNFTKRDKNSRPCNKGIGDTLVLLTGI